MAEVIIAFFFMVVIILVFSLIPAAILWLGWNYVIASLFAVKTMTFLQAFIGVFLLNLIRSVITVNVKEK